MASKIVILEDSIHILKENGVENPVKETLLLLSHITGKSYPSLIGIKTIQLKANHFSWFESAIIKRADRVPFHYITGKCPFWNHTFSVNESVLIPRPETELIVEYLTVSLENHFNGTIIDCCTGSGCLGISLAHEFKNSMVIATDISQNALDVASGNANEMGCKNIMLIQMDLLTGFKAGVADIVVANPPYVDLKYKDNIQPEVSKEPELALYAEDNGLEIIKKMILSVENVLKKNGLFIFEFGIEQSENIRMFIEKTLPNRYDNFTIIKDLSGKDRTGVIKYA